VENSESNETTLRARHALTDAAVEVQIRYLGCFSVTAFTREDRETVPMAGGRMWARGGFVASKRESTRDASMREVVSNCAEGL
jgi:hypothetical protein